MSPVDLAVRCVVFGCVAATFWYGLVPLALGTAGQLLGLFQPKR